MLQSIYTPVSMSLLSLQNLGLCLYIPCHLNGTGELLRAHRGMTAAVFGCGHLVFMGKTLQCSDQTPLCTELVHVSHDVGVDWQGR